MFESYKMAQVRMSPLGIAVIVVFLLAGMLYIHRRVSVSKDSEGTDLKFEPEGGVPQTVNLRELLSVAIVLAERGGERVKAIREGNDLEEQSKGKTLEGANDPLTDGDLQSHRAMYHGFKKAYPTLRVISEEHEENDIWDPNEIAMPDKELPDVMKTIPADEYVPVEDVAVWIDPLDATQEYTEKLTQYVTTMVCVAVKGLPTIGVIHKPFEHKTAWAWVNKGNSGYELPPPKSANEAKKIIVSRSHAGDVSEMLTKTFGENTEVIPAGGAGYKTWALFEQEADAYVHVTLIKKWDICAGNALLNHKNGIMTDLKGDNIDYSADSNPKNEFGLLATLSNYKEYLQALQPAYENLKQGK